MGREHKTPALDPLAKALSDAHLHWQHLVVEKKNILASNHPESADLVDVEIEEVLAEIQQLEELADPPPPRRILN